MLGGGEISFFYYPTCTRDDLTDCGTAQSSGACAGLQTPELLTLKRVGASERTEAERANNWYECGAYIPYMETGASLQVVSQVGGRK